MPRQLVHILLICMYTQLYADFKANVIKKKKKMLGKQQNQSKAKPAYSHGP